MSAEVVDGGPFFSSSGVEALFTLLNTDTNAQLDALACAKEAFATATDQSFQDFPLNDFTQKLTELLTSKNSKVCDAASDCLVDLMSASKASNSALVNSGFLQRAEAILSTQWTTSPTLTKNCVAILVSITECLPASTARVVKDRVAGCQLPPDDYQPVRHLRIAKASHPEAIQEYIVEPGQLDRRALICRCGTAAPVCLKVGLRRAPEEVLRLVYDAGHPRIIPISEVVSPDLPGFLVQEVVYRVGSLSEKPASLFSTARPWFLTKRFITREVLGFGFGLLFLHSKNLFHGFLNSSNIMFNDVFCLMIDFASSRCFRGESAPVCDRYSAPELLSGGEVNSWSDVFSFGVLMYEMFTESSILPENRSLSDFHNDLKSGTMPPIPDWIDADVGKLIHQCLSFDVHSRPSIQAVLDRLLKSGPDPFFQKTFSPNDLFYLWSFVIDLEARTLLAAGVSASPIAARFRVLADSGDSLAQVRIGFLVERALGCSRDARSAARYYKMAAD
jgi:hypothetical protein